MANAMGKEDWSWRKFLSGIFEGRNWGKALIFGLIFLAQFYLVQTVVNRIFPRKPATHQVTESINANSGSVVKSDSHDTVDKKSYSLLSLFDGWFK